MPFNSESARAAGKKSKRKSLKKDPPTIKEKMELLYEKVLDDLDLVFSYEISQFDNKMVYYKIIYNGPPNKFLIDLKTKGIEIDTQKQNWKIE